MSPGLSIARREQLPVQSVRALADQAFSRAAGAPLVEGNCVRLLRDATENYPAWLEAIASARRYIHFETYIFARDEIGERFADALIARARAGVQVRVLYDWLGCFGKASRRLWRRLREGGVEVRCFNPPRLEAPLGWLSRDHRKMIVVDGETGFVTGLCVARDWVGSPEKRLAPWRDTGVEIRGPAVAAIARAFADVWAMTGEPLPDEVEAPAALAPAGTVSLRIVATEPSTAGMLRIDQLVAALARQRLWLTDAYYAGVATHVQALCAAARQGVDVRLLVPGSSDIPVVKLLSRAGYRTLLEGGVRVFEWKGTMLHAKTAVADGRWARVGSTNLNLASWLGNCELDAVIEDEGFAQEMEAQYLEDLSRATEIVLPAKGRLRPAKEERTGERAGGSAGKAAAGAVRIGHAIGAAVTDRRVLESVEARLVLDVGMVLLGLTVLFAFFPKALAYPLVVLLGWFALSLLVRGARLGIARVKRRKGGGSPPRGPSGASRSRE